eukprot:jgi/Picre1/34584/NNA_002052.t1
MSTADIGAEVGALRKKGLVGMRVTNVYDIGPKLYALRLARVGRMVKRPFCSLKVEKQHKERIENLSREIDAAEQKALVLQSNLDKVDAAIESYVRAGCRDKLERFGEMIEMEKDAGNPVAELIHSLKLEKNTIALSLFDPDVEKMIALTWTYL